MSRRRYPLAVFAAQAVGTPYALGAGEGVDCFSLVIRYLQWREVPLPDEYEGLTLQTYAERFAHDPLGAKDIMVRLMDELLEVIPPPRAFAGDIVLLELAGSGALPFLAIHAGQASVLAASPEHGVRPWGIEHYEIRRAWSCRPRSPR